MRRGYTQAQKVGRNSDNIVYRIINVTNSSYCNWACNQSSFCLRLHGDEANGQYNTKWPISLVYALKPLINAIRAIKSLYLQKLTRSLSQYALDFKNYVI